MTTDRYLIIHTDTEPGTEVHLYETNDRAIADALAERLNEREITRAQGFGGYPGNVRVYDTEDLNEVIFGDATLMLETLADDEEAA